MCEYTSYHGAVTGVLNRVDHTELVQHLAHNDDTHPKCRQTGGHGPEATIGHCQRPEYHQDQVHHGWLQSGRAAVNAAVVHLSASQYMVGGSESVGR